MTSIHRIVLLAALALASAFAVAAPAAAATQESTGTAAATEAKDESTAAERRAAKSDFEREALDPEAFGEEAAGSKGADAEEDSSGGGGSLPRFIFGLVVVLGVIYAVHWLLKKWGHSRLEGVAGRAGVIDVVATTNLAQGRALHLVRVGDELVLVGATDQSITRIGELDANALGASSADRGNGEFQAMLSGAMLAGQPGVPQGMGGTSSADQPFIRRFIDNLRLSTAR